MRARTSVRVVVPADASWLRSLDTLRTYVGVTERTGRNDGPAVERILASVGLGRGNPWCYALQYHAFAVTTPRPPILRTGLVAAGWNDAMRRGSIVAYEPLIGDLVVWRYLAPDPRGHIERIFDVKRGGWVITIGGNVPPEPPGATLPRAIQDRRERDGQGAWQRRRNVRHPLGRMLLRGLIGPTYDTGI